MIERGPAAHFRRDLYRVWCMRHYAEGWRAMGARDAIRYLIGQIRKIEGTA